MKTELFSNISHEFKTPLNVILSTIQLLELQKRKLDTDYVQKENRYLKVIKQNCFRLIKLVNNLLDLTRLEMDFFETNKKNYDVVNLINKIAMSVVNYAEYKNIKLEFESNVQEKIMALDTDHIERVMLNLLSNAIKFTHNGGVVKVILRDYGDNFSIIVKDNGVGIPKEKQEIIFQRFGQLSNPYARKSEGSGIGLYLVKAIVERNGGTISLISDEGKGSEFIVNLPCELISDDEVSDLNIDNILNNGSIVERINIEFSDIYS